MSAYHEPIMVEEIIQGLAAELGKTIVDGTVGGGGHAAAILAAGAQVIGLDQDPEALAETRRQLGDRLTLIQGNFRDLQSLLLAQGVAQVDGILLDLGVSSHQLDDPARGFGFHADRLDMRMNQMEETLTAADFLAQLDEPAMAQLFTDLGEERAARKLAHAIVAARRTTPITDAQQLREIIWEASSVRERHGNVHPATRVFQALRLAINAELPSLAAVLPQLAPLLRPGGRVAIISFHSLEDRLVKRAFQEDPRLQPLQKKPLMASSSEIQRNPRARSAKVRFAEKV